MSLIKFDMQRDIEDLKFFGCIGPDSEVYAVNNKNGKQIGYIEVKNGELHCYYPDINGVDIFSCHFSDSSLNCFSTEEERMHHLEIVANELANKIKNIDANAEEVEEVPAEKFDVRICKCGRIHFVKWEEVSAALEADKNLMVICGGCGMALVIGADREPDIYSDDPNKEIFNMYSFDRGMNDTSFEITADNFVESEDKKAYSKIIYSPGKRVPMESGYYAKQYYDGFFYDTWYPDFYKIQKDDITVDEVMNFIKQWEKERSTVSMNRLLSFLTDSEAEALSHYWIKGLNWAGTKYETKWNS